MSPYKRFYSTRPSLSLFFLSLDNQKPMCSMMWQFSVLCNREEGGTDTDMKMCHLMLKDKNSHNLLIQQTLLVLLPKVAALNQELFTLN